MDIENAKKRVLEQIEKDKDETLSYLEKFISHESLMGNEKNAQHYYAELLKKMNLSVDIWEPKPEDMDINPSFMACRDDYAGSPNVAGVYKGKGGGRSMMLSGHVDVVPEGATPWSRSPWEGKRENGRIYGRGSADMKGGIIANLMALKAIQDAGFSLKGDVVMASVIGEETGGAGTLSLLKRGYRADGGIIPEPSNLHICPVSMGVIWFRVKIKGILAHAANAHLGVNSIVKSTIIINALEECNIKERMTLKHELYTEVPNPFNINIGQIDGGNIPTSVPDSTVLRGRIAFSPDEDVSEAKAVLENAVKRAAMQDPWLKDNLPEVEWYGFCLNSGTVGKEHPLTQLMINEFKAVTGNDPNVSGTPWGNDSGAMIRYGGIPTIVFGPGPRETAHQVDEYVDEAKLITTAKVIASTLIDWCELA